MRLCLRALPEARETRRGNEAFKTHLHRLRRWTSQHEAIFRSLSMPTDPVRLTAELIRCPSVTPEDGGAMAILTAELEAAGFTCLRADRGGVANLFARWGDKAHAKSFGFNGHTDVVPVGNRGDWTADPFGAEIRDGYSSDRDPETDRRMVNLQYHHADLLGQDFSSTCRRSIGKKRPASMPSPTPPLRASNSAPPSRTPIWAVSRRCSMPSWASASR